MWFARASFHMDLVFDESSSSFMVDAFEIGAQRQIQLRKPGEDHRREDTSTAVDML
jgi:hypothetical protein